MISNLTCLTTTIVSKVLERKKHTKKVAQMLPITSVLGNYYALEENENA